MARRRYGGMGVPGVALLALCALPLPAAALDFLSVTEAAPLFDAPSAQAKPLFVIAAGTPVERILSLEGWSKVRDNKGDLVWIEKKYLGTKRNVMVRGERAEVRTSADEKSALVFAARHDVLLELIEILPGGWVRVKHRDGQGGYVKAAQVWGL
ncbi:MAG: SH3 domain-containing protein [Rugosibacter sp.]|nr:SH3 domain-containing protein [Rugosibacter sp.]